MRNQSQRIRPSIEAHAHSVSLYGLHNYGPNNLHRGQND